MTRNIRLAAIGLVAAFVVVILGVISLTQAPTARADTTLINVCKATNLTEVNQAIGNSTIDSTLALVDVQLKPITDLVVKVGDTVKVRDGVTLTDVLAKLKCQTTEVTTTETPTTTETSPPAHHKRRHHHSSSSSSSGPVTERPVGGAETGG